MRNSCLCPRADCNVIYCVLFVISMVREIPSLPSDDVIPNIIRNVQFAAQSDDRRVICVYLIYWIFPFSSVSVSSHWTNEKRCDWCLGTISWTDIQIGKFRYVWSNGQCMPPIQRPLFYTSFSILVFNDGNNKELLNINGTIPVVYKSKSHSIWLTISMKREYTLLVHFHR